MLLAGVAVIALAVGVTGATLLRRDHDAARRIARAVGRLEGRPPATGGHLGEHLDGHTGGICHRGRLHNLVWLNDGYHAEHHRWPGAHWTQLPARRLRGAACSAWIPVLRALVPRARRAIHRDRPG